MDVKPNHFKGLQSLNKSLDETIASSRQSIYTPGIKHIEATNFEDAIQKLHNALNPKPSNEKVEFAA